MADAAPVWALGLMCGTSMDGVDAALLETDGERVTGLGPSLALEPAYDGPTRTRLADCMSAWADGTGGRDTALGRAVDRIHAAAAIGLMARHDAPVAALGYHGQTVFHAPERGLTVQLGDGAWLAETTGVPVVWDFRAADVAAGGEGAPLAPFYHWALARRLGAAAPIAFLNIGGVANVTWIDPRAEAPEAGGALLAFDTGPGNALIDDLVRARTGMPCDRDGALAARGRAQPGRLASNAASAFLARRPPKSLDRNAFAALGARVAELGLEDAAATLTAFTADCVAAALPHLPEPPARWLVCGGGRRNPVLMARLADRLGAPVEPVEAAGLDGDMLEAQAFAFLAVRALRGLPLSAPGTTGCPSPLTGGRISRP
ncbi:anhydro-N-acetylmuramic acid kinase [Paralimibaculum aggregatum]|uniref:Anhydro-N-acetylmuramic acid kinase n=1 Tax=Paralimibaculum aggregatum TaxID=3036245 RepID=A0ABQ6LPB5_9RHOB|nr:anhydro-N-acetylmuramic acid kinase [Limibaculum sp. NKW23]GMG83572.1 anhydro-N-acetylmuramic acid kinase [Limibaculum sp. NKW23]